MKGGKYTKTLAKIQVEGIIRIRGVRRNDLPKFIEMYGEDMLVLIRDEHQHGDQKTTETPVTEFCYRNANLLLEELI